MNLPVVGDIASHLAKVSEDIEHLSNSMTALENGSEVFNMYEDMLLDRVKEAQKLFVSMTQLVLEDVTLGEIENEDEGESAFAEGELTSVVEPDEDEE